MECLICVPLKLALQKQIARIKRRLREAEKDFSRANGLSKNERTVASLDHYEITNHQLRLVYVIGKYRE